ncbi:MAG: tetratricopeptide repeat protein [Lachnospiraceae bacterium]|nr:tetratricopeptide repeat protein [Lachnospiraceae bacterium]MDD6628844.1 tetratricopeptide repeat protein [Lachnospiraceae bacterium]
MNVDQFYETLDSYFARQEIDKVDPFLVSSLQQAKEEEDYAAYISICNEMIGFYRSISAFEKAYVAAEDVLLLMEELQLDHSEHFATTLLNTATAYRAAGDYTQALRYYRQALQIYDGLLQSDDYRFAGLYNNMSILLEKMEENEEAISYAEKALAIIEKLEGGEMETATTLTNLALIYFKVSKPEKAKELLEQALALFEKSGENTDAHYSGALAGVGEAYYHMQDYEKALKYYEKALTEVQKHFGENMSYAVLCENCAAVCERLGNREKQGYYIEKAKEVQAKL